MRPSMCLTVLFALASPLLVGAQTGDSKRPEPKPVTVEKYDFPKVTKIGEQFSLTVTLKNRHSRTALVNARLIMSGQCEVVASANEQLVLMEADTERKVTWQVKRVGDGKASFITEVYLLTDKRNAGTPTPNPEKAALEKTWQGTFTEPGHVYEAKLTLRVGAAEGRILWTLKKAERPDYKDKIGFVGTEFVWGC